MSKIVRPTVRFTEGQNALIQTKLQERGISFQQYCSELICSDLGRPLKEFEEIDGQMAIDDFFRDDLPL